MHIINAKDKMWRFLLMGGILFHIIWRGYDGTVFEKTEKY